MKASALLIQWHNEQQPIYSAHFDPHKSGRLATAGGDNNIRLWSVENEGEQRKVTYLSTLIKHTQSVNVVRFCPKGEMLASAGDDGNVLLWVPSEVPSSVIGEDNSDDKETWRVKHMCRSTTGAEIYDLAWSPDGLHFITGGVDNTARIYNASTGEQISERIRNIANEFEGQLIRQIAEHSHYVQGVAWDPLNEFIATQSSDRSVHIYALKLRDGTCTLSTHGKFNKMDLPGRRISSHSPVPPDLRSHRSQSNTGTSAQAIASPAPSAPGTPHTTLPMDPPVLSHSRRSSFGSSPSFRRSASPAPSLPLPAVRPMDTASPSLSATMGLPIKNTNIYHNETFTSFFRRLTFAPDGSLLFTPSGQYKSAHPSAVESAKPTEEIINTVYIYTRAGFNKPPVAHLPGHKKPSVAVKCSPIFYTLRTSNKQTEHITIDTSSAEDEILALPEPILPAVSAVHTEMEPPPLNHPSSVTSEPTKPQPSTKPPDADNSAPSAFALPYRVIYAVATQDAVYVYDTQQQSPLCVVSNLHYATFSDLTWSNDGLTLLMTSSDGFCSTLAFAPGELGERYHGPFPAASHTTLQSTNAITHSPAPTPTPGPGASPSLAKSTPVPAAVPSPAPSQPAHFAVRPGSPTRSNSTSSIATMSSIQTPAAMSNNPTPTVGYVPGLTAASFAQSSGPTPPQTPIGGLHSATSSISGSVLGKREASMASESEKEDAKDSSSVPKKRRVAPTLISGGKLGGNGEGPSSSSAN
ncbi:putative chromatin assembly factor 1 subunit [Phaeomoniella chlamydospora]|uniref:Putative chromatin assembly factor 1 subunit n=1 Tax=Phaeomoniella chlamydospora TaxID=158046 RepID=A0A0G2E953_PHACM|nr:putative chromatin assembly factor 1 subunit [Phaeomoniella chlamydospora]